jgi:hypothetical protein
MAGDVERFLAALRSAHPDMEALFLRGQCYALWLILRTLWPEAQPLYSASEGHVYVRIAGGVYDIRGRHLRLPRDLRPLGHRDSDKPHRWGRRDRRRLVEIGVRRIS